jgi:signal transduction histidine kinase
MTALRNETFDRAGTGLAGRLLERISALKASVRRGRVVAPELAAELPATTDGDGQAPQGVRPAPAGRQRMGRRGKRSDQGAELEAIRRSLETTNEELRRQNLAVRESRARMIQADEGAKRAIAEELHGTVQTRMYVLWVKLCMLRDRFNREGLPGGADLDKLAAEVDNIREENIRKLSHRLHPAVVRLGAISGLRSLRDFFESFVPIDLQIGTEAAALEPPGMAVLPEHIRLGVYRVAELALGNVIKHARATRCTIRWDFEKSTDRLLLSITDNGVGLVPDARVPSGLGLVTMNDYADALNGTLVVTSFPGKGTRVEVSIPHVPEPEPQAERQSLGTVVNLHWTPPE